MVAHNVRDTLKVINSKCKITHNVEMYPWSTINPVSINYARRLRIRINNPREKKKIPAKKVINAQHRFGRPTIKLKVIACSLLDIASLCMTNLMNDARNGFLLWVARIGGKDKLFGYAQRRIWRETIGDPLNIFSTHSFDGSVFCGVWPFHHQHHQGTHQINRAG